MKWVACNTRGEWFGLFSSLNFPSIVNPVHTCIPISLLSHDCCLVCWSGQQNKPCVALLGYLILTLALTPVTMFVFGLRADLYSLVWSAFPLIRWPWLYYRTIYLWVANNWELRVLEMSTDGVSNLRICCVLFSLVLLQCSYGCSHKEADCQAVWPLDVRTY